MTRRSNAHALNLEQLPRMTMEQLRALWAEHMGRAKMPMQKRLLIRELAWRTQERLHGGLDAETKRLLRDAIRAAEQSATPVPQHAQGPAASSTCIRRSRGEVSAARATSRELPNATRLTRTWRGVTHEVHILDGGHSYRYRDNIYKSLTEIAREITGTRWSGPRFFGLTARSRGSGGSS